MSKKKKVALVPRLRFPEFCSDGEWQTCSLGDISDRITEKVGEKQLITLSISAGIGFVSQAEKFSRDISGKQYENYIQLKKGDFSYNKGNSKKYPQGCIYELKEYDDAAVPNAFISFRLRDGYVSNFYKGYFDNNFHGRQLTKFITSGARSDGLLNINSSDFLSIILPTPKGKDEQQKIADCLSSLDDLINAEDKKLGFLKAHKKGLLQKLFPAEGETVPEIRFNGYNGVWVRRKFSDDINLVGGATPFKQNSDYWGGNIVWLSSQEIKDKYVTSATYTVTQKAVDDNTTKVIKNGTPLIVTRSGVLANRFPISIPTVDVAINQDIKALIYDTDKINTDFFVAQLQSFEGYILKSIVKSGTTVQSVNVSDLLKLDLAYPSKEEQTAIGNLFCTIDELITAQADKIETLKAHKKGLMQGLFPSIEEANE